MCGGRLANARQWAPIPGAGSHACRCAGRRAASRWKSPDLKAASVKAVVLLMHLAQPLLRAASQAALPLPFSRGLTEQSARRAALLAAMKKDQAGLS